ncbi:four helix bundle protein [Patescibacteria group bacterium]|nr:four helix bundle protein [Patescibacteria group bacterium]
MQNKRRDLEERTTKFGIEIILFAKNLKRDLINIPLISQIIRSATSIGANYREATGASSQKDFKNKLYICKKECQETKHWLELIAETNLEQKEKCRELWKEAQELTLIFSQAILTLEKKK